MRGIWSAPARTRKGSVDNSSDCGEVAMGPAELTRGCPCRGRSRRGPSLRPDYARNERQDRTTARSWALRKPAHPRLYCRAASFRKKRLLAQAARAFVDRQKRGPQFRSQAIVGYVERGLRAQPREWSLLRVFERRQHLKPVLRPAWQYNLFISELQAVITDYHQVGAHTQETTDGQNGIRAAFHLASQGGHQSSRSFHPPR